MARLVAGKLADPRQFIWRVSEIRPLPQPANLIHRWHEATGVFLRLAVGR